MSHPDGLSVGRNYSILILSILFVSYRINFTKSCRYFEVCYANTNMNLVKRNQKLHNQDSPLLIGDFNDDIVKEVREPNYIDMQSKLL